MTIFVICAINNVILHTLKTLIRTAYFLKIYITENFKPSFTKEITNILDKPPASIFSIKEGSSKFLQSIIDNI